jgi:hypothetical protein
MKRQTHFGLCLIIVFGMFSIVCATEDSTPVDPQRIEYFRKLLPIKPEGVGPKIGDRAAWEEIAKRPAFAGVVKHAEAALEKPLAELTDDLFLDYSRTGNRYRYQSVQNEHHRRLSDLVYAECVENHGRFLPAIEEAIVDVCNEKTWVLPAHDGNLNNFEGKVRQIDLRSAQVSWALATAAYWLGEKLTPEIRSRIADELERRTFHPWDSYLRTGKPEMNWPRSLGNWNAVCLSGVTGAALANVESLDRRAYYAAAAEKGIQIFLRGFTPDGYCSEGIGYWNYGFGHYVMLAETLRLATCGKINWLSDPKLKPIALGPLRLEILPGVYPAFADCVLKSKPDDVFMACLSRRLKLGLHAWEARGASESLEPQPDLPRFGLFGVSGDIVASAAEDTQADPPPIRHWFSDAGILICRPGTGAKNGFGAALKGGHNAEFHNHNDVGTFVVAMNGSTPILDIGSVTYTRDTFSRHRYENDAMNSFGHNVPRVGGKMQSTGKSAQAKVLATEFTTTQDTLVFDLRSGYDVPSLKKLHRTFVFSRKGNGKLTVTDEVEFNSPQAFDTALMTFGPWKLIDDAHLLLGEKSGAVQVAITTKGSGFRIDPQEIHADLHGKKEVPVRLGIQLTHPITQAKITTVITPAE